MLLNCWFDGWRAYNEQCYFFFLLLCRQCHWRRRHHLDHPEQSTATLFVSDACKHTYANIQTRNESISDNRQIEIHYFVYQSKRCNRINKMFIGLGNGLSLNCRNVNICARQQWHISAGLLARICITIAPETLNNDINEISQVQNSVLHCCDITCVRTLLTAVDSRHVVCVNGNHWTNCTRMFQCEQCLVKSEIRLRFHVSQIETHNLVQLCQWILNR